MTSDEWRVTNNENWVTKKNSSEQALSLSGGSDRKLKQHLFIYLNKRLELPETVHIKRRLRGIFSSTQNYNGSLSGNIAVASNFPKT